MKRLFVTLLTITALFLTGACGDNKDSTEATDTKDATTVTVTQADANSTKTLAVGDTLVVALDTSGGSGYSWKVLSNSDTATLKFVSSDQKKKEADAAAEGMVGTPEVVRTTFKALKAGTSTIELGHVSPTGGDPEETFKLTVTVE